MSTSHRKAYPTDADHRRLPRSGSEKSDTARRARAAMVRIKAALVARDSSLRAWGLAWGRQRGFTDQEDLQNAYNTVRRTVERWAHRPDAPRGLLGASIMAALRADLGPTVIPPAREPPSRT